MFVDGNVSDIIKTSVVVLIESDSHMFEKIGLFQNDLFLAGTLIAEVYNLKADDF